MNFENDIVPLFRQVDQEHMLPLGIDLWDYNSVKTNAPGILSTVMSTDPVTRMPPDDPWNPNHPDRIATFQAWIDAGSPEFDSVPLQINVVNPGNLIDFNDVPEGETAMRAAVFDCVVSEETINFSIVGQTTGPYGVLIGTAPVNPKAGHQTARIWLSFTGTTANTSAPNGSVTIHCAETNEDFDFDIHGNTIARQTVAVELVLDQSESMDWDAGTTGIKRMDVLKSAAGVFADVIQDGNAAGIVRFDHLAYGPGDAPPPGLASGLEMTTIGPSNPSGRQDLHDAINDHATNPAGATSVGAGVELGRSELNSVAGFVNKAMIVFTDGLNNTDPTIDDAMASGAIDGATFAIGLGDATQVDMAALTALCNNNNGFVLLTDTLTPDTSDFFLVKKYFLEILAGVQNNQIIVDPVGKILPGQVLSVPFHLSDADIQATTILLTDIPALRMRLRTPAGDLVDPTLATSVGAQYTVGQNLVFYRYLLPLAVGAGAQSGTWNAVLEMDPAIVKRCKEDQYYGIAGTSIAQPPSVCQGVRYSVQVHAWSNLRMKARILQTSFAPGATLTVRAVLTEYNMPVDHRATVSAAVTRPDDTQFNLPLNEIEPGVFEASTGAAIPGIYKFLVHASGKTLRGISFTREQYLTAAVLYGGDNPPPTSDGDGTGKLLCCLFESLLHDPGFIRYLEERKIDVGSLLRCLEECCVADKVYEPGKGATIAGTSPTASVANLSRMIASNEKLRSALADLVRSSASPR